VHHRCRRRQGRVLPDPDAPRRGVRSLADRAQRGQSGAIRRGLRRGSLGRRWRRDGDIGGGRGGPRRRGHRRYRRRRGQPRGLPGREAKIPGWPHDRPCEQPEERATLPIAGDRRHGQPDELHLEPDRAGHPRALLRPPPQPAPRRPRDRRRQGLRRIGRGPPRGWGDCAAGQHHDRRHLPRSSPDRADRGHGDPPRRRRDRRRPPRPGGRAPPAPRRRL
ncbi:MAG: TrkA-like protein, partial [uncultured Thermomicrobiales bacterium]